MTQTILAFILSLISFLVLGMGSVFSAEVINNPTFIFKTPYRIKVTMTYRAMHQYEQRWGQPFNSDYLDRIDEFFWGWQNQLGTKILPTRMAVVIKAWDEKCIPLDNDIYAPYGFWSTRYGCIDGAAVWNTAIIHLGDDPGTDFYWTNPLDGRVSPTITKGYCMTALGHEFYHIMTGHQSNWNMPQNPDGLCN